MLEILQAEDINQQCMIVNTSACPTYHRIIGFNQQASAEKEAVVFTIRRIYNKEQKPEMTEEEQLLIERARITDRLKKMNAQKRAAIQRKITHTKKEMRTDAQLLILDILEKEKLKKKRGRQPRKRKKEAI